MSGRSILKRGTMLYDTHIHTRFSHDSRMHIEEATAKAAELGLGIIITEHIDLNYPDPTAFRFDPNEYFKQYALYHNEFVKLGVEIGLSPEELADNRQIIESYPFDYVLGSIHIVNKVDTYCEEFYTGKTKQQAYDEYLDTMLECVGLYSFIDSLGHIDYICRYARYANQELYYSDFRDKIDQILRVLASEEKCLELNTRRIVDKKAIDNLVPIYKRFKELGGKYVTIGSDAHYAKDIGKNFQAAIEMVNTVNLKPVWFCERKIQYID